jgi:hypothetical protein
MCLDTANEAKGVSRDDCGSVEGRLSGNLVFFQALSWTVAPDSRESCRLPYCQTARLPDWSPGSQHWAPQRADSAMRTVVPPCRALRHPWAAVLRYRIRQWHVRVAVPIPPIAVPCAPAGFGVAWAAGGVFWTGATDCACDLVLVWFLQGFLANAARSTLAHDARYNHAGPLTLLRLGSTVLCFRQSLRYHHCCRLYRSHPTVYSSQGPLLRPCSLTLCPPRHAVQRRAGSSKLKAHPTRALFKAILFL